MATKAKQRPVTDAETAAPTAEKKPKRAVSRKAKSKRRAKQAPVKTMKAKVPQAVPAEPAPKPRARKKQSTVAERAKIIAAADRDGLTALQVQKRFGVKPVTYYSWRKKLGLKGRRGRRPAAATNLSSGDLSAQVRAGVQARVRELLPGIVREEVAGYLDAVLGGAGRQQRIKTR